jgi:hypothetical protein
VFNLTAPVVIAHQVTLDWTNPGMNLDGAMVRRAAGSTAPATSTAGTLVGSVVDPVHGIVDATVAASTTYSYSVFAYNDLGYAAPASITVTTPAFVATDYTLFGTGTPTITTTRTDGPFALGNEFYVTSTAWAKAIRFWRPSTAVTGTITGRIYLVNAGGATGSAVTGTDVTFTLSGTGWQSANLAALVALTINQSYRVVVRYPGSFPQTSDYWRLTGPGASGRVNGPLVAPSEAAALGGAQSSYAVGAMAFPAGASGIGQNWWADVTVTDGP